MRTLFCVRFQMMNRRRQSLARGRSCCLMKQWPHKLRIHDLITTLTSFYKHLCQETYNIYLVDNVGDRERTYKTINWKEKNSNSRLNSYGFISLIMRWTYSYVSHLLPISISTQPSFLLTFQMTFLQTVEGTARGKGKLIKMRQC